MSNVEKGEQENKRNFGFLDDKIMKEFESSLGYLFLPDVLKIKTREKIESQMKKNGLIAIILAFICSFTSLLQSAFYLNFSLQETAGGNNNQ